MMNNMYMGFYKDEVKEEQTTVRKASAKQIKFYDDLCRQRNMQPENVSNLSFDELSKMIDELTKFYPASQPQIDLINNLVKSLSEAVDQLNFTEEQIARFEEDENNLAHKIVAGLFRKNLKLEPIIKKLTGGKTGTASDLINKLNIAGRYFEEFIPVTNEQIETITSMFLCPDVDFEKYGITRRIDIDLEEGTWRKPTPEELAKQIRKNLNKKSATQFIGNSTTTFYNWTKTRIRPNQLNRIKSLESQLNNDSKLREIKQATTLEGNIIEVGTTDNVQIKGIAYVQHTDEQLIQFSIEQASEYISQLQSELARVEESTLEEELSEMATNVGIKINSIEEAIDKETKELSNIIYSLEAIAGYQDEDLHHAVTEYLVYDVASQKEAAAYIREFIQEMINNKAITYMGLLEIAANSEVLQRIIINM